MEIGEIVQAGCLESTGRAGISPGLSLCYLTRRHVDLALAA
jgi:hypothetical protein